jgi:hypothetical protein
MAGGGDITYRQNKPMLINTIYHFRLFDTDKYCNVDFYFKII